MSEDLELVEEQEERQTPSKRKAKDKVDQKESVKVEAQVSGITISQFVRIENLGHFKNGFVVYVNKSKIGGRKTRAEWYQIYEQYMKRPKSSFRES